MTGENSQPPVAWRYCGNQIKRWRTRKGITREELGEEAGYQYETVKSMEQGRRCPTHRLLEVADEMCDAHGLLVAAEEYLKPERYPWYSQEYMQYEAEAIALSFYQTLYIPGLLQTEEYVRAVLTAHSPPLGEETMEERVKARLERQSLLGIDTHSFSFVVEESALRRRFANEPAYERQLQQLIGMGEQHNVVVQVMPFDRGLHTGLLGPFALLETASHEHFAYEEGQTTGVLYSDPEKVSIVTRRHDTIVREALCPGDSARFITKLLEER